MLPNILINILDISNISNITNDVDNNITTSIFTNILNQLYSLDDSSNINNLTPDISLNRLIENSLNNILEIPNSYNTTVQEQESDPELDQESVIESTSTSRSTSRSRFRPRLRPRLMSTLFPTHTHTESETQSETQSETSYPNNNFLENFINSTFNDTKKYKKVIHTDELTKIKKRKFNASNDKNIICPIFMTNFTDDKEVAELPCGHIYVPEGIDKWLKEESNTCPVCRYEFEYMEITINPELELEDNDELDESPAPITRSRSNLLYMFDYLLNNNTLGQIITQDMNYYIPDPLIENELNYDEEIELQRILLENPHPPT